MLTKAMEIFKRYDVQGKKKLNEEEADLFA